MEIERIAAFCDGARGGNPAGVVICDRHPDPAEMQRIAAEVGYSETAFAAPVGDAWRVRYFAPTIEVPFCGHATIALGAALAARGGGGPRRLLLNNAEITVDGFARDGAMGAVLRSPVASSRAASDPVVAAALDLFGYEADDLDPRIAPAIANAGNDHLVLALAKRAALAAMRYDFEAGRVFMQDAGLTTIILTVAESADLFHARNPFAAGGVYEDPATGSAAAALSGYLRDIGWRSGGAIRIAQGDDMGVPSRVEAAPAGQDGTIRVKGMARYL